MRGDDSYRVSLSELEASAGHRPETWIAGEAMPDPEPPTVHAIAMTPMSEVYAIGDLAKSATGPPSRGRPAARAFVGLLASFYFLGLLTWIAYWLRHS